MARSDRPGVWLELELARQGADVQVGAQSSRGERVEPQPLGPALGAAPLAAFAAGVRDAAARGRPLGASLLAQAQALHTAVFRDRVGELRARLGEAAGGPLLVRLRIAGAELQAVPWEALAAPGSALGFWASSPDLRVARGVISSDAFPPREVRGGLRVLAIAPQGGPALARLEGALEARIASGEVEWLEPIEGPAVRLPGLFERLRREPFPHVLHFLGHGGLSEGKPVLWLAEEDGEETRLPVELLAQQLKAGLRGFVRLVVLEACEGAQPSAFASAAEILARTGIDAVVAHLWPVKADVGRLCSEQLYRALAGKDRGGGDIAFALNEARRAILGAFEGSAEAFSPVLTLRGESSVLFDFKGRKVVPPAPRLAARAGGGLDPALGKLLGSPFSLLLGDQGRDERLALDGLRDRLDKALAKSADPPPKGLPLSALCQRFSFLRGAGELGKEFQRAFPRGAASPPLLDALARRAGPGVHTTLHRGPLFEHALAEHRPDRTIYVLQPGEQATAVLRREASGEDWEALEELPPSLDLREEIVVLRLYRGYTSEHLYAAPLLTEDDYLFSLRELESVLPPHLAYEILSAIHTRPALLLGLSLFVWDHRVLLQRLFGRRPLPFGSLAVLEPGSPERALWEKGTGLPGEGSVPVVEAAAEDLAAALAAVAEGDER